MAHKKPRMPDARFGRGLAGPLCFVWAGATVHDYDDIVQWATVRQKHIHTSLRNIIELSYRYSLLDRLQSPSTYTLINSPATR